MKENFNIDERLSAELSNIVYEAIADAIANTSIKHNYKEYDIAKLIMAIYQKNYEYIINDNDFREQVQMLDEYFENIYNHSVMTFIIIKKILSLKYTDYYDLALTDIKSAYSIIKTGKNTKTKQLETIKDLLDNQKLDQLMSKIEKDNDLKYAFAIVYERTLNQSI